MTDDWTDEDILQHKRNFESARTRQSDPQVIDEIYRKLVQLGARNIVKVVDPGQVRGEVGGFVTTIYELAGLTPIEIAKALGLKAGALVRGAHVYRLERLPAKNEFDPRGYSTLPDGAALPEGKTEDRDGYRAGHGAWQIRLRNPIKAEFLGTLNPGVPFSLNAVGSPANLSGAAWWHANEHKYPNSDKVSALLPAFERPVSRFIDAMRAGGARVIVSATRRHRVRAELMLYSFMLSRGEILARQVPRIEGCDIIWDHGDEQKSRKAAEEMRKLFGVVYKPSLKSLHITGQAIDMTITWSGALKLVDAQGKQHTLAGPGNGSSSRELHRIGASYGVHKLLKDPPHWSVNGH